ncbi:MAG: hypothetical protein LBT68_01545 [Spirochaetales bacterium]|nr:hypothetical protein [Spirochaetales bacterium]
MKKVTIDDVWAVIERVDKQLEENTKEFAKMQQENSKELAKVQQETEKVQKEAAKAQKEMQKALAKTDRIVGSLGNKFGSMAEHIMTPDLINKFRKFGFTFTQITNIKIADKEHSIYAEIDALLENGKQVMVVEVKVTLRPEDVDDHIKRMEKVRKNADLHGDARQFLGALSALVVDDHTKTHALKQGFFIIEPSGEDVKVTPPFSKPKIW